MLQMLGKINIMILILTMRHLEQQTNESPHFSLLLKDKVKTRIQNIGLLTWYL